MGCGNESGDVALASTSPARSLSRAAMPALISSETLRLRLIANLPGKDRRGRPLQESNMRKKEME